MLQSLGQLLEGAQQIITHALGADLCQRQNADRETITQIIYRNRDRVVAALFATQYLQTMPGFTRLSGHCLRRAAVAIVEQRTEQRRRSGHTTATLSQCQRRMLMAQQAGQALMSGLDTGVHALGTQFDPQRQGIDKQTQGTVRALAALHTPHQHGAEHHVFTA
ncbi:hypothetical protein PSCICJ_04330 [Pseudomonas cichorii]|nr:hypothetical protein PSCICJ_04330 [Pseudomonas cichorii]